MRIGTIVIITILLILSLYIVSEKENGTTPQEIKNMLNSTMGNITFDSINYTDPYSQEMDIATGITNIILKSVEYGIDIINIVTGFWVDFAYKYLSMSAMKNLAYTSIGIIYLIMLIFFIRPCAYLYFMVKEFLKDYYYKKGIEKTPNNWVCLAIAIGLTFGLGTTFLLMFLL